MEGGEGSSGGGGSSSGNSGSNSNNSSSGSSGGQTSGSGGGGILPRPPATEWTWAARNRALRAGFFLHGPRPPAHHPYMRHAAFFRPHRGFPLPPPHFPHRQPVLGGWSGGGVPPPRMLPPPFMPPPPPCVPPSPGGAPPTPTDPYLLGQPPPPLPWPTPPPTPTSTTEDDPSSTEGKKRKKKAVNGGVRPWNREAAERALAVELECQKRVSANAIVIRFPDPDLSKEIVQAFHSSIENVHFQSPCGPRYCFVMINKESDVDQVIGELNKVKFGNNYLKAERKVPKNDTPTSPESIDPFTLYVGNLPTNISALEMKEKFPTATRIDIGYAQKIKFTRYAFVRYGTASEALKAYKESVNTVLYSRSIILRFRRHKGPVGPKGEKPCSSDPETAPTEKLTVGAKLKIKREKQKAEKEKKEKGLKSKKKKIKLEKDESSSDEEVELENDEEDDDDDDSGDDDDDDDDDDDSADDDDDDDGDEEEDDDDDDDPVGKDDDDDDDDQEQDEDFDDDKFNCDDMLDDDGPDDDEYLEDDYSYKNEGHNTALDWDTSSFDF